MKDLTPYDEQYYRTDFYASDLLKQANFNKPVSAWYNYKGQLIHSEPKDFNHFEDSYSAPLIDVALHWLKELGYYEDFVNGEIHFKGKCLNEIASGFGNTKREADICFIKICCNHIITLKENEATH